LQSDFTGCEVENQDGAVKKQLGASAQVVALYSRTSPSLHFQPTTLNFHSNIFLSLPSATIKDWGRVSAMAVPLAKHTISSSVTTKYKHDAAVFVDRDDQQCIEIGPGSVCFWKLVLWRHNVLIMLRATKVSREFSLKKVGVSLDGLQSWLNPALEAVNYPSLQDIVQRR
jgi:hypothetical protein